MQNEEQPQGWGPTEVRNTVNLKHYLPALKSKKEIDDLKYRPSQKTRVDM